MVACQQNQDKGFRLPLSPRALTLRLCVCNIPGGTGASGAEGEERQRALPLFLQGQDPGAPLP